MDDSTKQIGQRLRELREVLDIPAKDMAQTSGTSLNRYMRIEEGHARASIYLLTRISRRYGIGLDTLLYGDEPLMNSYFTTRKSHGKSARHADYTTWESLASGFRDKRAAPFMVAIEPLLPGEHRAADAHDGQEFVHVVEGRLRIILGEKTVDLSEGDSFYFDATRPHSMESLDGKPARLIVIIV